MKRKLKPIGLAVVCVGLLAAGVWLNWPAPAVRAPSAAKPVSIAAPPEASSAPPPPLAAPAAPPSPAPRDDYHGPLAEIVLTETESQLLHEAEEQAVKTCMNERGFEYLPTPFLTEEEAEPWNDKVNPGDLEAASVLGYSITRSRSMDEVPPPEFPNEALLARMSEAELAAWDSAYSGMTEDMATPPSGPSWLTLEVPGVGEVRWDTNSCLAQARRAIYGDDRLHMEDSAIEQALINEALSATRQDPMYLQSIERWQQCMATKGHRYQAPGEPEQALWQAINSGQIKPEDVEAREIEIASADAICYQTAGIDEARQQAQARIEAKLRDNRSEDIARLLKRQREALKTAENWAQPEPGG